ncbi:hypothetical protein [Lentzea sp. NPDC003310]|uniref:hypothetical protein n=1 Tax=Lentzea sp. NPDC003310 TaxID=3154447 RepID=UPI0033B3B99D
MSDNVPADLPQPRKVPPAEDTRAAALDALSRAPRPLVPEGRAGLLTDRMLVHACFDTGYKLLDLLPQDVSGLVLSGKKARAGIKKLRRDRYEGALVADPEGYREANATEDDPFVLANDGLFSLSLNDVLQAQLDVGATVAMTPTGYIPAGEAGPLKAAADIVNGLDRDDFLFSVPIGVAWLTNENYPQLRAILSHVKAPKVIMVGGQFDPYERNKDAVANLRRLIAEAGPIAVFRTDLVAFDVMCHGGFAASIGTGGSLRHVVPYGQIRRAKPRKEDEPPDTSPSVLFPELMSFHKGSLLQHRFSNVPRPPKCKCDSCRGRSLDTFLDKADAMDAHAHGVHIWSRWSDEMRHHRTLGERAQWWKERCRNAVDHCATVNAEIKQKDAFDAPSTLKVWANLPAWASATTTKQPQKP